MCIRDSTNTHCRRRAVVHWIPTHCDVPCNERADVLAFKGGSQRRATSIGCSLKRSIIRTLSVPRIRRGDDRPLSTEQQVGLMRLRTGHSRLKDHVYKNRSWCLHYPTCLCGQGDQKTGHVPQRCPFYQATKQAVWPTDTPLTTNVWPTDTPLTTNVWPTDTL